MLTDETLEAAATDYGGIEYRRPRAVVQPRSAAAIATAIAYARSRGWPVAARGRAGSAGGQALAEGGVAIEMAGLASVDLRGDGVEVGAGADWSAVLEKTLPLGLTPPVLPDFLGLSVGGTLAVGGVGPATYRRGLVADAVTEFDIVTGCGELLTCSPTSNADLFAATIGGLGQFGIVTRARVGLVPVPPRVRVHRMLYADCRSFVDDLMRLALAGGPFDGLKAMAIPNERRWLRTVLDGIQAIEWIKPGRPRWLIVLEATHRSVDPPPRVEGLGCLPGIEHISDGRPLDDDGIDVDPGALHPWSYPIVSGDVAAPFLERTLAALEPREMGDGLILIYPLVPERVRPCFLGLPEGRTVLLTALLPSVKGERKTRIDDFLAQHRRIAEDAAQIGGIQYPVGALRLRPSEWRAYFGSRWDAFSSLKRRYDPGAILARGHGIG